LYNSMTLLKVPRFRGEQKALWSVLDIVSSDGRNSPAGLRAMSEVVEEYRRKSRECTEMAARVIDPADQAAWLSLAEGWLKLAQQVSGLLSDSPQRK
jgi:hypothetical protein